MSEKPSNPSAFPQNEFSAYTTDREGLALRDYFAIHCDQPGAAELITAAGLSLKSPACYNIVFPDGSEKTFAEWWNALSQAERFGLYAKVRFGIADAMLAERERG